MKIRILKNTVCGGKDVYPGDEIEASAKDASYLIGIGKAEDASNPAPQAQAKAAEQPAAKPRRGRRAR